MRQDEKNLSHDGLDREIVELLNEADERPSRPDHAGPRGNQEAEGEDVARGQEKLDRVL